MRKILFAILRVKKHVWCRFFHPRCYPGCFVGSDPKAWHCTYCTCNLEWDGILHHVSIFTLIGHILWSSGRANKTFILESTWKEELRYFFFIVPKKFLFCVFFHSPFIEKVYEAKNSPFYCSKCNPEGLEKEV